MLDLAIFLIGVAGFGAAGYLDLKTTEFPDLVPYGMIGSIMALRLAAALFTGNFSGLLSSALSGGLLLGFGLLFYFAKQWGDGDAWLLGVLGFILPNGFIKLQAAAIPDYILLLLNFFIVSFAYIITYSLGLGVWRPDVRKIFVKKIKEESRVLAALSAVFVAAYYSFVFYLSSIGGVTSRTLLLHASFPLMIVFVLFFLHLA